MCLESEVEHFLNGTVGSHYCERFSVSGGCAAHGFSVFQE